LGWDSEHCGFQLRECIDLNKCNKTFNQPNLYRSCYYTLNPSCFDKIKNCHNRSCEVLMDCGGPCPACPSCSDKIKNQGEDDIDCGGPCFPCKAKEEPLTVEKTIEYFLLISFFFAIIFILVLLIILLKVWKKVKRYRKRREREF
jgi:hypothetical protein